MPYGLFCNTVRVCSCICVLSLSQCVLNYIYDGMDVWLLVIVQSTNVTLLCAFVIVRLWVFTSAFVWLCVCVCVHCVGPTQCSLCVSLSAYKPNMDFDLCFVWLSCVAHVLVLTKPSFQMKTSFHVKPFLWYCSLQNKKAHFSLRYNIVCKAFDSAICLSKPHCISFLFWLLMHKCLSTRSVLGPLVMTVSLLWALSSLVTEKYCFPIQWSWFQSLQKPLWRNITML